MEQEQAGGAEKASWAAKAGMELGFGGEANKESGTHLERVMSALLEGGEAAALKAYFATPDDGLKAFTALLKKSQTGERSAELPQLIHAILQREKQVISESERSDETAMVSVSDLRKMKKKVSIMEGMMKDFLM